MAKEMSEWKKKERALNERLLKGQQNFIWHSHVGAVDDKGQIQMVGATANVGKNEKKRYARSKRKQDRFTHILYMREHGVTSHVPKLKRVPPYVYG